MGALARTRSPSSRGGGSPLPRSADTTRPSRPSRRTSTTPSPPPAPWIIRSSTSSSSKLPCSTASRGSSAAPARFAASASPRACTSAASARRSCCVATRASATQAVAITVTIRALNLNWRDRKRPPEDRGGRSAGPPAVSIGLEADVEDLELARPLRHAHDDAHAGLLAEQGPRDRRGHRDASLRDVGLLLAEDGVGHALAALDVLEVDRHAEAYLVGDLPGGVDHLRAREAVLEQAHAALEVALALLRGVELRILRDVTVRARRLDLGAVHSLRPICAESRRMREAGAPRGTGGPAKRNGPREWGQTKPSPCALPLRRSSASRSPST